MHITVRTVLTACLLNSIVILILCPILKSTRVIKCWGAGFSIVILEACVIRMFVPFEFGFTHSIYLEKYWTSIVDVVCYKIVSGNRFTILSWQVLCIIWVIGIVYFIIKKYWNYYRESKIINLLEEIPLYDLKKCLDVWDKYSELEQIKIVCHPYCNGPFLKGIFKPVIVLSDRNWSREELGYVLMHEILHYRGKDILLKIAVDILCTFFWWNPVFIYLKNQLFHLIEVRNDLRITQNMSTEEKIGYLNCLMSVVKSVGGKNQSFSIPFSKSNKRNLKQRIEIITGGNSGRVAIGIVFSFFMLCAVFSTIGVVLEPVYPEPEGIGISLDENNTYLIRNGNIYDVYVYVDDDWQYFFSDSDRKNFSEKVTIYEKEDRN